MFVRYMDKWRAHVNWAMDLRCSYSSEKSSSNCYWSPLPFGLIPFIQQVVQCHPSSTWPPVLLLNRTHTLLILCYCLQWTWPVDALSIANSKSDVHFLLLRQFQNVTAISITFVTFRSTLVSYGEESLAPHTTLNLEGHLLSAVRNCLCSVFTATLHIWRPSPPFAKWAYALPWWQVHILNDCNFIDAVMMWTSKWMSKRDFTRYVICSCNNFKA